MVYMKVKTVSLKNSHHKEKMFIFMLYLYEMIDVH